VKKNNNKSRRTERQSERLTKHQPRPFWRTWNIRFTSRAKRPERLSSKWKRTRKRYRLF